MGNSSGSTKGSEMILEAGGAATVAASALPQTKLVIGLKREGYWRTQGHRIIKYRSMLWFLIPAMFFTLVFSYVPILGSLFSFKGQEFNLAYADVLYNMTHGSWTFQNYLDIFVDATFYTSVGNTLIINLVKLVLVFPFFIFIAVQLSELKSPFWSKFILIIICLPNFLSWAVVVGIWSGLFDSQGGILNDLFVSLHFIPSNYAIMAQDMWFKPFAIFLSAWKGAGWGSIMFYAAIVSIDKSFYESATIDGAGKLKKIWSLTIPSIMSTIALMLVMNISGIMDAGFEQIFTMMQINSNFKDTQIILGTYLYDISVVNTKNIPFATALGVFNGLIGLFFMIVGNFITKKTMHRSLW